MPEWFKQYLRHVGTIPIPQIPLAPPQNLLMVEALPRVIDFPKLCKDFQNMGGKCFNGTEPYNEAIAWITNCERITRVMGWDDALKRRVVAWHLRGEALEWWTPILGENIEETPTWNNFKEWFELRFLFQVELEVQLEKFMQLRQGGSTLKDYISKFTKLAMFGRSLIDTPRKKAMRFVKGLNSLVREFHLAQVLIGTTCEVLVDMTLLHETKAEEKKKEEEKAAASQEPKKDGRSFWRRGGNKKKFKRENMACHWCNKTRKLAKAGRVNLRRVDTKGKCFNCLEPGHYSNQCPKSHREGPSAQVNAIEAVPISTQPSRDTGKAA